jgi:glycosyltransferase involved in cell wall biosynthesis
MGSPKVSVVCAWYNRANYICDTIDSLLNQDFDSFEVVIVNDGSVDPRVKEILDSYDDYRLKIIHQENTGFVSAIKRAIASSEAPYIAIQGAGDISLSCRLRLQSEFLDANLDYGLVGCKRRQSIVGGSADGMVTVMGRVGECSLNELLYGVNPFSHGEVMFRREIYQKVGGYRNFFRFAQDRDLWIRMAPLTRMHVLSNVLYERRGFAEDGIKLNKEKLFLQHALSVFSRQCHHDRVMYGQDFVEKYGEHGGLFRKPSSELANRFAKLSIKSLFTDGGIDDALRFSRCSIREGKGIFSTLTFIIVFLSSKSNLFHRFFRTMLSMLPSSRKWGAS